jgi:hypothetical protein
VLVAEDEALILTSTPVSSSWSATGGPSYLFFTISADKVESPLYIGHYPATHVQVHPNERQEDAL